jgi:hypothetical protein
LLGRAGVAADDQPVITELACAEDGDTAMNGIPGQKVLSKY